MQIFIKRKKQQKITEGNVNSKSLYHRGHKHAISDVTPTKLLDFYASSRE